MNAVDNPNNAFAVGQQSNTMVHEVIEEPTAEMESVEVKTENSTLSTEDDSIVNITPRRIRCPDCTRYSAETEEKMLRHIRKVHRGENPFQCYMCDYSTYNKSLFEEHVRIHQGIKPFKCSHCSYRSVSKKNTKKHELIHRPDNPLKCPDCDFIARNSKVLVHHKRKDHSSPESQNVCPKCDEKFSETAELMKHKKSRKKCQICKESLCQRNFRLHMKKHKGSKVINSGKKVKKVIFKCDLCKWESSSKPRILLHLIHHPNQKVDETLIDVTVLRECGILPPKT